MTEKIIDVKCTSSHLIDVNDLTPIQGNLKTRTRQQIISLRDLIIKYGFSFPVFVWNDGETNFTLDGHGRDYVCRELVKDGYIFRQQSGELDSKLPCIFVEAKDRIEAKEKLLAINSSHGTITNEGLFSYLFEPDFELDPEPFKDLITLPGVDLVEFVESLTEPDVLPEEKSEEKYFFAFSQEQLKEKIKQDFPNYKTVQEIVESVIDYPLAMHHFNRLCGGALNVGTEISLLFNPHRLETRINNRSNSVSDDFIKRSSGFISSISQWMSKQRDVVHNRQYLLVARANTGTQIAHEFKPYLARDIYRDYCKPGAKVLDPCAGWGGRMIGFCSAMLGGEYHATDPSTRTYNGLLKLKDFLLSAEAGKIPEVHLHNLPFEELELPDGYFDFAFTSPPYFDTELYADEDSQAYKKFPDIDSFNEKFLSVLIHNVMNALKPGCCLLLNIGGSQHRFDKVVEDICFNQGLEMREVFKYKIGKGDHFSRKIQGNPLDNSVKANDLFFEIRKK